MAIKQLTRLPEKLPAGRLYLDDLEDITNALLDAYTPIVREFWKADARARYVVNDHVRVDSIADLKELGGSAKRFSVEIEPSHAASVSFVNAKAPRFSLAYLGEEEQGILYVKLKAIFERHQYSFRNALENLPLGLIAFLVIFFFIVVPQVLMFAAVSSPVASWASWGYAVPVVAFTLYMIRPNRAIFMRSHEHALAASETKVAYVRDLVFLVLGAAIGQAIRVLANHLFK